MATDIFPVFDVLVNSIFGSVGLALVGVAVAIALILLLTRTSTIFLTYWLIFYGTVAFSFYLVRGVGIVLAFILSLFYVLYNLSRLFFPSQG